MLRSLVICIAFCGAALPVAACEEFKTVDSETAEKMMSVLDSPTAKSLDQIFAFQTLACADQPILRRFATDEGLKSKNRMLRSQALAEIVLQRNMIKIEMVDSSALSEDARRWIKQIGGSIVYMLSQPNRKMNCISIGSYNCKDVNDYQIRIDGEKIKISNGHVSGDFTLSDGRMMRGTVKYSNTQAIQSKIDLD